ncbi:hypothetical protein LPJ59_000198 [Coemansia sp. RSA 2399]|nr:hypothetical protein LPJ59_000198 [Coemansia sp. RSA 2399]
MHVRLVGSGLVQHLENYTKPLSIRQQPVTSGGFGKSGTPTDEITSVRTGILYNDDNQTYCEVLMSSQTVGVAAASCFDYVNNEVDPNVSYSVIVSSGTNSTGISGTFKATKVTPHPEYDPTTYANNVAVMQFMAIPGSEFTKQIADWPAEWKQYYMVHRSLTNVMPYVFNAPKVSAIDVGSTPSGCTDASAIYAANADDYICNMVTIESYLNSNCVAPFGSVYGDADPYPANLAALFSHSAIYGTGSYCGQGPFYNYYLILRNYIPWIQSVAQTDISTYHIETSTSYTAATNVSYVMQNPTTQASGVVVVGNYTTQEASSSEIERVSALFVSASEDMDFPTSDVLASNVSPEVNIVTSTDMVSSTVVVSTTATISETTTLEATDVVSQTSTILTTSTVLATSTTVELSIMTITATDIVPTAIGATNSIISPVIVYVTDINTFNYIGIKFITSANFKLRSVNLQRIQQC